MKKIQILTWIFAALFLAAACSSGGDEPANPGGSEGGGGGGGGEPQPEANVTSQVYKPGESGYAAFRIPAVVVSKAGTVLAFAEGRVDGSADDGNIDLLVKRSEDNGNTWSTPDSKNALKLKITLSGAGSFKEGEAMGEVLLDNPSGLEGGWPVDRWNNLSVTVYGADADTQIVIGTPNEPDTPARFMVDNFVIKEVL